MPHAPCYSIPADDKDLAQYLVGKIIHEEMTKYTNIVEPKPYEHILKNIEIYKEKLAKKEV